MIIVEKSEEIFRTAGEFAEKAAHLVEIVSAAEDYIEELADREKEERDRIIYLAHKDEKLRELLYYRYSVARVTKPFMTLTLDRFFRKLTIYVLDRSERIKRNISPMLIFRMSRIVSKVTYDEKEREELIGHLTLLPKLLGYIKFLNVHKKDVEYMADFAGKIAGETPVTSNQPVLDAEIAEPMGEPTPHERYLVEAVIKHRMKKIAETERLKGKAHWNVVVEIMHPHGYSRIPILSYYVEAGISKLCDMGDIATAYNAILYLPKMLLEWIEAVIK